MKTYLWILFVLISVRIVHAQHSIPREFRGVWVATVANIDWPSTKNLSSIEQKKEIIRMLDHFKELNFNAIIFQIRPAADAFYNSRLEPWSYYLNGSNNKAPFPYYDPLAFWISEAHKRGMELHAWINPYRAVVNYQEFRENPLPLTYEKPEWFINYGSNKYFDPGNPEVRSYTKKIVTDIVQNYDVDAIHMDDYFYPYKINGQEFDDERSFSRYGGEFYPENKDDWRRQNVNRIIVDLQRTIKEIKPWVRFGLSPFGVWRNQDKDQRGSKTSAGQTNYDDLYADVLLWMKNGWLDYVLPQAYWHIGHEKVDYREVVRWWSANSFGTNLYVGLGLYRLGKKTEAAPWAQLDPNQIEQQLDFNESVSRINGNVFFSARSFQENPLKINDLLKTKYYDTPILQPVGNNSEKFVPQPVIDPKLHKIKNRKLLLEWQVLPEKQELEAVKFLVFLIKKNETFSSYDNKNLFAITGETSIIFSKKTLQEAGNLVIIAVSRNNNVSDPVSISL